ncbi:MAG: hypothetical protein AAGF55_16635, partial [Pseudomonadota bacterium]
IRITAFRSEARCAVMVFLSMDRTFAQLASHGVQNEVVVTQSANQRRCNHLISRARQNAASVEAKKRLDCHGCQGKWKIGNNILPNLKPSKRGHHGPEQLSQLS